MLIYIARRALWVPVLLVIVSIFVFVMGHYGPGDPIEVALGQHYTKERAERLREQRGLDRPLPIQYVSYVREAIRGDFGDSLAFQGRSVSTLLGPKLWVSAQLFFASMIISIGIGVPLGFYSALRQGTPTDPIIVGSALVLNALPVFITAPVLIIVFALKLSWVPVSGWGGFFDERIILPAVTVGIGGIAVFTRLMRVSTLEVLSQDYVRTARSKGLGEFVVRRRHIARNALIPIMTVLGFSLAGMFGGSFITELIFGIPGVARFALDSIFARDFPVITALVLIGTTMLVIATLLVDILYAVIDPRIRYN